MKWASYEYVDATSVFTNFFAHNTLKIIPLFPYYLFLSGILGICILAFFVILHKIYNRKS